MVPLYLDDCLSRKALAREVRAAGHVIHLPRELAVQGQADVLHLATATKLGAVLVSQNQADFAKLHRDWQSEGHIHSGIITTPQFETGRMFRMLERAARLLERGIAANHIMHLSYFDTEEHAQAFVASITPSTR